MTRTSIKVLLGALALLVAPSALADSSSIRSFEAKVAAARGANSNGGATVTRLEAQAALESFLAGDEVVEADERAHLTSRAGDEAFLAGFSEQARKYLVDFHELNDAATSPARLGAFPVRYPPSRLFGADGPLARSASILEGSIQGEGVANQATLRWTAESSFGVQQVRVFRPIMVTELTASLRETRVGAPSDEELEGAMRYITQLSREGQRLYVANWRNQYPSLHGGFIVAAVSADRRTVRYVLFYRWAE